MFHPSTRVAYVNCELGGTVVACSIDDSTGLTPTQTIKVYPADFVGVSRPSIAADRLLCVMAVGAGAGKDHPENFGKASFWTAEALLGPDARFLYVICRIHHSIAIVPVGADGALDEGGITRFELLPCANSRNMTREGSFLLVASQDADAVEVLQIDAESGGLKRVDTQPVACAADCAVA